MISRRVLLASSGAGLLAACETIDPAILEGIVNSGVLSEADAARGIRAALNKGIGHAVSTVGRNDGFWLDNIIKIPLPGFLQDVQSVLKPIGADGLLVELHEQLNRGAEKAAPVAQDIFVDAISGLSIQDAINIVKGSDDAATQYLQDNTGTKLATLFSPIMENALGQTGALQLVDQISGDLSNIPFAPKLGADARNDLILHGVNYGLDGLFHYIAIEEKAIRDNPAKRTSEILRKVFG